ncbi:hypothetical protein B0A55_00234 [Friedmanniomyces simplex]|uniref:Uncharacterized protein n=1 Tax=Friedmanniomyces simplex TaxID=329884 RepID=A0A4U0Y6P4_9PEZI|nr:hypothetical protein B0A55_00234 [Friedmanniomyces simplex]
MADYPSFPPGAHPTFGGKSLENLPGNPYAAPPAEAPDRSQPYKSWRKKYRKMRAHFDGVLEENKRLFKEEHKLESLAKRLREELDGLLDVCLDLNENPSLPPDLRFNIRPPPRHPPVVYVPPDITPEQANDMFMAYKLAVQQGSLPPVDLQIIRNEVEQRLAAQDAQSLDNLIASMPSRPVAGGPDSLPDDLKVEDPPGYFTSEQEAEHLLKLDARLGSEILGHNRRASDQQIPSEDKHFAEMTRRELERHVELLNPQSQHNWLKAHHKLGILPGTTAVEIGGDDNESLASHEPKPPRKRAANKNLAKQVGDRAVERARDGGSPVGGTVMSTAGNGGGGGEEDELLLGDGRAAGGSSGAKKRAREVDNAYHPKGGKKTKRKRSGEDISGAAGGGSGGGGGGSKKPRTDGGAGGGGAVLHQQLEVSSSHRTFDRLPSTQALLQGAPEDAGEQAANELPPLGAVLHGQTTPPRQHYPFERLPSVKEALQRRPGSLEHHDTSRLPPLLNQNFVAKVKDLELRKLLALEPEGWGGEGRAKSSIATGRVAQLQQGEPKWQEERHQHPQQVQSPRFGSLPELTGSRSPDGGDKGWLEPRVGRPLQMARREDMERHEAL